MKGDRFERLEQLRKEAAERLRLPLDHDKTQLLAALRLNHETLVEKLVAGQRRQSRTALGFIRGYRQADAGAAAAKDHGRDR